MITAVDTAEAAVSGLSFDVINIKLKSIILFNLQFSGLSVVEVEITCNISFYDFVFRRVPVWIYTDGTCPDDTPFSHRNYTGISTSH